MSTEKREGGVSRQLSLYGISSTSRMIRLASFQRVVGTSCSPAGRGGANRDAFANALADKVVTQQKYGTQRQGIHGKAS